MSTARTADACQNLAARQCNAFSERRLGSRCAAQFSHYCLRTRAPVDLDRLRSTRCAIRRDFFPATKMLVSGLAPATLEASLGGGSGKGLSAPIMHWVT